MQVGRARAEKFQRDQITLGAQVAALVKELGRRWKSGELSDKEFQAALVLADRATHAASVAQAKRFVDELRRIADPHHVHADPVGVEFDAGASLGRAIGLIEDVHREPDLFDRLIEAAAVRAHRWALNAGRDTVMVSAAVNGKRWRRITDANPCAFCAMLATRDDYTSKEAALRVAGGRRTTKRPLGAKYHDRCGCTAVEVLGDWDPTSREREFEDLYRRAEQSLTRDSKPVTAANLADRMRMFGQGIIHDALTD